MDTISPSRQQQIKYLLDSIEQEHKITIIHAVESGSRAWGFPSKDSDYDIRFIYHHPLEWYITAFDKKDNIEIIIEDDLDAGGWDVGKCLRLLHKGNAVIHEWLNSPIIYRSDSHKHHLLRHIANQAFNPAAAFYHYHSQVKKRLLEDKTRANAKAFLYGFRSLLCAQWISKMNCAPPVLFDSLAQKYLTNKQQQAFVSVLQQKAAGGEQDKYQIPRPLWENMANTFEQLGAIEIIGCKPEGYDGFDRVLKEILIN